MHLITKENKIVPIECEVKKSAQKVEYQFQDICLLMEAWFGKSRWIWSMPYNKWWNDTKARDVLKECQSRKVRDLRYFYQIMRKK